jgi:hypothetical protein
MFKKTFLFASIAGACMAPLAAQEAAQETEAPAASNPALEAVLEHVPTILDKKWKSTFHVQGFEGENQMMDMTAAVKFQDKKHFAIDLNLTTQDEFEGDMTMTFSVMADGTYIYINSPNMAEVSQGMMSGPVKVELALFEKMMGSQMGGMAGAEGFDKDAIAKALKEQLGEFTFKEEGSGEGLRRFVMAKDEVTGHMSFEKEHWFLSSAEIVMGTEGKAVINTSENAVVEAFPEGTFTFTAAIGETVMDLTPMIQMSMPQEEVAEEDLEF